MDVFCKVGIAVVIGLISDGQWESSVTYLLKKLCKVLLTRSLCRLTLLLAELSRFEVIVVSETASVHEVGARFTLRVIVPAYVIGKAGTLRLWKFAGIWRKQ